MTVTGQSSITYTYDNANRLTQMTQGSQTVSYSYDDANRRLTTTLPNGIVVTYDYDAASQLTGLTYTKGMTTLGTLTYDYDDAGNRTIVGGTWARTGLPPAEDTWTYNAANRLTTRDQATFTYDDNGDVVQISDQGTTMTFTWNARHQLVGISGGGITASFTYDGLGRRISKTVNSATTDFHYDGLNPIQELAGGSPVATLLTGLGIDEVISRTASGSTSTFLADALGSTVALTDGTGAVQTEYTYDPFGAVTVTGTSSTNAFQFTGREQDGTGLYFYRARYYSPLLQRFISEDPIGFAGGDPNLYAYVFNSPSNYSDPTGLFVWGFGRSGSAGGFGVVDGAVGFIADLQGNVDSFNYGGGSLGWQFAGTVGNTFIFAPFAKSIYDLQGNTFDINIRFGAQATMSIPIDFNLRNTTFAFDTPGLAVGVGVGFGGTKIGFPGGNGNGPGVPGGDGSGSGGPGGDGSGSGGKSG